MNPTPKQRSVIYRKAAELIDSGKEKYIGYAIANLQGKYWWNISYEELKLFPEPSSVYNKSIRVFALLFASEIAKQK
jgi:hypothetical protein